MLVWYLFRARHRSEYFTGFTELNSQENSGVGTVAQEDRVSCLGSQSWCVANLGPEAKLSASRVHALNHCLTLSLPRETNVVPMAHKDVEDMHVRLLVAGVALIHLNPLSAP